MAAATGAATLDGAVAAASVPTTEALIYVGDASTKWLDNVQTQDRSTTMQSFAFDNTNGLIYTAQVAGHCDLTYASATKTATASLGGDDNATAGDMCVTQLSLTGTIKASMYLLGFGHGVSIGVQPTSSGTYIWTECDASDSGYGTCLARFAFSDGALLWPTHPSVQRLYPVADAVGITPSIDMANGILLTRHRLPDGTPYLTAYDLTAAAGGDFSGPLASLRQPVFTTSDGTEATFQGYCSYGQYAYLLDGDANVDDIYTTSLDLNGTANNSSGYILRTHSAADASVTPREPEGMAIYTGGSAPRLCFGITDNATDGTRRFDLYYKV